MELFARKIVEGCGSIVDQIRAQQMVILEIAEDQERKNLLETIYDLEQAVSLLNRASRR